MIRAVYAENFLSFETLHIEFPPTGLTHIFGRVTNGDFSDSNGAGKTAILSCIKWVLFGINDRGKADDVIRRGSKGGVYASVTCVDRYGKELHVSRYRKHKEHGNQLVLEYEHGVPIYGTDNKDTQRILEERLGLDYATFARGFIFDGSLSLARMKDTEAKTFFERLLGTDFDTLHQKAKGKLIDARTARNTKATEIATVDAKLEQNELHLKSLQAQDEAWSQQQVQATHDIQFQIDELQEQIDAIGNIQELFDISALENQYKALDLTVVQSIAASRTQVEQQVVAARNYLNHVRNAPTACPTCHRAFDYSTMEAYKLSTIVPAENTLTTLEQKLAEFPSAEELNNKLAEGQQITTKINNAQQQFQHKHQQRESLRSQQKIYQAQLEQWGGPSPYADAIGEAEETEGVLINKRNALVKQRDKLDRHIENCTVLVDMFSTKGLRSFMLDRIIPHLNARITYYLGRLTNNRISAAFQTTTTTGNEKFHLTVERQDGGRTYESLSQGEKSRLDLALILALFEWLRVLVGAPLLFFDELMDGLDATGTERVLDILKTIAQDVQIVVISHNPYVALYTDRVLTVIKEKGISRVENGATLFPE